MMSESEIRLHLQKQKKINEVSELMQKLVDATNLMGFDAEVAEGIFLGLIKSHRTLQQDFMRSFFMAMKSYSEVDYDLRNEQAVKFAKKIAEDQETYFPYV